jgi:hypothetical protein
MPVHVVHVHRLKTGTYGRVLGSRGLVSEPVIFDQHRALGPVRAPSRSNAMSGQPTAEWQALARPAKPVGHPGKEQVALRRQMEALLALVTDPLVEGAWLDITGKDEPLFIDATEARRKAGLPDVPGRRVIGQGQP